LKSCLVIGLGRFGFAVASELCRHGVEVLGIDEHEDIMNKAVGHITHVVAGDAKDESVLQSIGARNFECAIVAVAGDVQDSVMITIMLKEMGVPYVIAKSQSELHTRVLQKIGADRVVFPEADMGRRLAQKLVSSNILDYIELSDEYSIVELHAPKAWYNKSIRQLDIRAKYGINILAVRNENDRKSINISPTANYIIKEEDILVIVGANEDIEDIK